MFSQKLLLFVLFSICTPDFGTSRGVLSFLQRFSQYLQDSIGNAYTKILTNAIVNIFKSGNVTYVEVNTTYGMVRGNMKNEGKPLQKTYYSFQGIPFAQPPIGPLRFKPPQPPYPWIGVKDALEIKSTCVQVGIIGFVTGNEDCLYINVYSPQLPEKNVPLKAVMFWIYGGSFQSGCSSFFAPDRLVPQDIVLVTFNYRVNAFGFLSLENDLASGNYGMKDQVLALKWVQDNIARFGGDPGRVTIFGESAGSASVHYHLLSPMSKEPKFNSNEKVMFDYQNTRLSEPLSVPISSDNRCTTVLLNGLFHQAILQSGSALNPWAFTTTPKQNAMKLARHLGYNGTSDKDLYNFFMNYPASDLAYTLSRMLAEELTELKRMATNFCPSAEGSYSEKPFITQSPMEIISEGNFNKVPVIIGSLNAEGIVVLSALTLNNNDYKLLNEDTAWAVPVNWNIKSQEENNRLRQKITNFFFHSEQLSRSNINKIVQILTDVYFLLGIEHSISAFLKHSNASVYQYEMVYEPSISFIKFMANNKQGAVLDYQGAAHADDVLLFFPLPFMLTSYDDDRVSEKMIQMWTNFAKTGNPNKDFHNIWKRVTKDSRRYLEIGHTFVMKTGRVLKDRLQIWEDLCKISSTTTSCDL